MIDLSKPKRGARKALASYPLYRLIPVEKYRDYAATTYFDKKGPEAVCEHIKLTGRVPGWKRSTVELALKAAFACGDDELCFRIAEEAASTFPESTLSLIVLSDLERYRGNYDEALDLASRAWVGDPGSVEAACRVVELTHRVDAADADEVAFNALECLPLSGRVLWAVCKGCSSKSYFQRIHDIWRARLTRPKEFAAGARAMANAALRAELFDEALGLYAEACSLELRGAGVGKKLPEKQLKGKKGLSVIKDVSDALERAGIPFFLAAGTALGVVRDGRPLDHDSDIDIGIFEQDWNRDALVEAFRKHVRFDIDRPHPKNQKIGLVHRGGASVDMFMFYREGEWFYHDGVFVRWRNSPFQLAPRSTSSGRFFLPEDEDRYLSENYGDWRTPDPGFDAFVDAPNMEVTWPEYHDVHRMRRAYRYIRAMDLIKAREELRSIRNSLERSEAGARLVREMHL